MRSETQPYSTVLQYGCVALRMRFFPQNFGTIIGILPGSSSSSHREGPGIEVGLLQVTSHTNLELSHADTKIRFVEFIRNVPS